MWCVMNIFQHQLVCYGLYPSSACFCYFLKQQEENKMSACMSYVGIIFRLTALFSSSFLFLSVYSIYNIMKIVMPKNASQGKDANKWPMDANFQTPASTVHKVEMGSANAYFGEHLCVFQCTLFTTNIRGIFFLLS